MAVTNPVIFIRPQDTEDSEKTLKRKGSSSNVEELDGKSVRKFYENIVAEDDSRVILEHSERRDSMWHRKQKRRKKHAASVSTNPQGTRTLTSIDSDLTFYKFLRFVQDGELKGMQKCLSDGFNVNKKDQFGWTPLMCAIRAKQKVAVQVLMESGADASVTDSAGKTVFDLMKDFSHKDRETFTDLLQGNPSKSEKISNAGLSGRTGTTHSGGKTQEFYCDICQRNFTDISRNKHETSTVHLFNCQLKPKPTMLGIPASNRGYQMLLRSGWNEEQGLGSKGQGQRFPVKTVLKRDRHGLGNKPETKTARVTHFGPKDKDAIETVNKGERKMRTATLSKRQRSKKERKDKQFEVNFRREFHGFD